MPPGASQFVRSMAKEIRSYRDLDAWQVTIRLTERVYQSVIRLPATERFRLSAQMRRASVSVPSNIAEGQACGSDGRYIHHLRIACGSLGELGTHLEIARRLAMLPDAVLAELEERQNRAGPPRPAKVPVAEAATSHRVSVSFRLWLLASGSLGSWLAPACPSPGPVPHPCARDPPLCTAPG